MEESIMEERVNKMLKRLDSGEMKMVQANVILIVPEYVTHKMIEENVKDGMLYKIEEHLFFTDDKLTVVEDDVTLLDITICDVEFEREE